ncbi:MAG TPA: type II toxin-antitoxin system PemK/MazF family toxin [Mycobacteriales bacterium]|jgi:mRNA interferase MazF|nr:type II toxin-antitoxin system PemK/MazF family toxin [Mycobacteriales bacterium]HVX69050.1 type II toxin-antitoxin system PemK/MazF family toxin [Mycobacteriales bacterium]
MNRGEVRWVDFEPARGEEANNRRPAIVVSNDGANEAATRLGRGVIVVVPVTSSIGNVYDFQVLLSADATGLDRDSKAQAEQVRAVAVQRVGARVGRLAADAMADIDEALRLHLAL